MNDKVIYHFYESELEGWLENLGIKPNKHRLELAQDLLASFLNQLDNEIEDYLFMNKEEILNYDNCEICDKCGEELDKVKNEDIYIEVLDMVLCAACHDEHKGIEKYWSFNTIEDYYAKKEEKE